MHNALAVPGLAKKTRDGRPVVAQFFAQHFDSNGAVVGMRRAKHGRRSALADFRFERVARKLPPEETLPRHAANLTSRRTVSKQLCSVASVATRGRSYRYANAV